METEKIPFYGDTQSLYFLLVEKIWNNRGILLALRSEAPGRNSGDTILIRRVLS